MALWGKQDAATPTGTSIGVTQTSTAVTGSGTTFLTDIDNGDVLIISGVKYRVKSVTSNTALVLADAYAGSTNASLSISGAVYVQQQPKSAYQNSNHPEQGKAALSMVFGVDTTEMKVGGDNVVAVDVGTYTGTRYLEVPGVTFSGGGGSSAAATASIAGGAVTTFAVTNDGTGYTSAPTVTVAKPRRTIPTTGVDGNLEQFTYTTHGLVAADAVKYYNGGGASATGLVDGTTYYVSSLGLAANTFRVAASSAAATTVNTLGTVAISGTAGQFTCVGGTLAVGDHVKITGTLGGTGSIVGYTTGAIYEVSAVTGTSPSVTGFTLTNEDTTAIVTTIGTPTGLTYSAQTIVLISGTGNNAQYFEIQATADQATAVAALGSGTQAKISSPGWVLRRELTGGKAGRVQYEVLVAGRSLISGDAPDDIQLPDA